MNELLERPFAIQTEFITQIPINILLIEDNQADADVVNRLCQIGFTASHLNQPFNLVHVPYLTEGRARLTVERFDIVLLDLNLPDGQGLASLLELKPQAQQAPIVILTSRNDHALSAAAMQMGAQDYLIKDELSVPLLTRTIRHAIERKQLHQALAAKERRFRRIIEQNADGILIVDKQGHIQLANPAAEQILHKTRDNLCGHHFEPFTIIMAAETELEIKQSDGNIAYVDVRIVEITWQQETGYLISLRDITRRKNMEAAVALAKQELEQRVAEQTRELRQALAKAEEAREQAEAILASVADGLIVTDRHNQVVMMNHAASQVLQTNLISTINRPLHEAISYLPLKQGIEDTITKNGRGHQFEFEAYSNANNRASPGQVTSKQTIHARSSTIPGKAEPHAGTVTVLYDVTKKRQLDRAKSEFIATAAHELRTPLTSIRGYSEIMLDRQLDADTCKRYLGYINQQAIVLSDIVSDMLDIGLVESGQGLAINRQPCQLDALIERMAADFSAATPIHQIALDLADDTDEWHLDARKIEQVLKNLLSNAIKYSPKGGLIKIGRYGQPNLASGEQICHIVVADHGIGMSPDQIDSIFDRFYRADASNTATAGVGIGMSIVKAIVKAHGGEIWVESEPGQGTSVTFSLVQQAA